jgi:hypothetical protein
MPMFYSTIEDTNSLINWNRIFSNSPTKVIMGLDVDPQDMNNFSISQQFNWLDQALNESQHSNLSGFSIWAYDYWSASNFATWSNWSTKNTIGNL